MARTARNGAKEPDSFGNQDEILLGVLTVIERDANTSQRGISRELGVALGLANAYLRRCVRKGLIKIKEVPRRRYAYYLTPKGFAEKTRLTSEYFSASFTFFRRARSQMADLIKSCAQNEWRRVVLYGVSDLAEVGMICVHDCDVELVGIVDPKFQDDSYFGFDVRPDIADFGQIDAIIVTALADPDSVYEIVRGVLPAERILAPSLVKFARSEPNSAASTGVAVE